MNAPDETIHQPVRLRIMAALTALRAFAEGLDFARLKSLTGATDGNLGAHIDHLARAGYVEVAKAFVGAPPAHHRQGEPRRPRRLRPPCRVPARDHRADVSGGSRRAPKTIFASRPQKAP